jgi:multicomponent Na+:H+ antiporter subunit G
VITTVLLLAFMFITNPTAAHGVARAAYEEGIEPWEPGEERR